MLVEIDGKSLDILIYAQLSFLLDCSIFKSRGLCLAPFSCLLLATRISEPSDLTWSPKIHPKWTWQLFCGREGRRITQRLILQCVTLIIIFVTHWGTWPWRPQHICLCSSWGCSEPPEALCSPLSWYLWAWRLEWLLYFSCFHFMRGGLMFCLLLPCYNTWGTLNWDTWIVEPRPCPVKQEVESYCLPSPLGRAHVSFPGLDWRHQPGSTSCAFRHLLYVSPKAYLRKPLNLIWPEIFLAGGELGWIPVYPFHFSGHAHIFDLCARPVISLDSLPPPPAHDPWVLL